MSLKIDYRGVMSRIKGDVDYVAEEAFNKGYEQAKLIWSGKTNEESYQRGLSEGHDIGYKKGLEDGKKAFDLLDAERDSEYQRGLEDAWGCAKKLFSEMSDTEIEKAFPVEWKNGFKGLMQMKPQYAIDKIKDYEAKQKQEDESKYHVGDEFDNGSGRRFVVMKADDNGEVDRYFDGNGTTYRMDWKYPNMKKTGRRFDVSSILKELR